MNLQVAVLLLASICFWSFFCQAEAFTEAVIECGRVQHIKAEVLSSVTAEFLNRKCTLKCAFANVPFKDDWINEERHCPDDVFGVCQFGKCVGGVDDAQRDCGIEFTTDFRLNSAGTAYINDQCALRCVLGGKELSNEPRHEGAPCPANTKGVCRKGACVLP